MLSRLHREHAPLLVLPLFRAHGAVSCPCRPRLLLAATTANMVALESDGMDWIGLDAIR